MPRNAHVLFGWAVAGNFGWGIYGLNLMLAWADRTDLLPATLSPHRPEQLSLDPLDQARIDPSLRRSLEVQAGLQSLAGQRTHASCLVLHTLHNDAHTNSVAHKTIVEGTPSIGVAFWEHPSRTPEVAERLGNYPLIIAGSSWNQQILREAGAARVELVLQGVDTSHFHPAPKRDTFPGRFVVFSGGKLEYRKGQDLVLRAFRVFARHHPDALLLTAWASPWPELARGLGARGQSNDPLYDALDPPSFTPDGQFDARSWTHANGIPDRQVFHCGSLPNQHMPRIYREADVALFPNRAEGGTNLVAMECMACAIPVILSANTGHLDLLQAYAVTSLSRQSTIAGETTEGWGESNIDEIVAALESVYCNRETDKARAHQTAASIAHLTWTTQMDKLATLLLPLRPE
jgi:glycosyltransferase involved in cell wall biosynthesis